MTHLELVPSAPGAWADACSRLDRAVSERASSIRGVRACSEGPGAALAARRLQLAEDKVAAQEAWLAWVELGD